MKGKKYYIAYGDAAALTIKNAIYDGLEKATIVCFRDDFTQGPLPSQFDLISLGKRKAYWQSLSAVLYNVSDIDAVLDYSIDELNQIGQGSVVYLWTGDSAYDRLATMWLSVLLDQKGCVVFNNSKLSAGGDEKIINLAMLSPKTVATTEKDFEIVHPMKISMWRLSWKNLVEENGIGLNIRTYERGVEDETLACGNGVTAAAIARHLHKNGEKGMNEIPVKARGGNLSVRFQANGHGKYSDIWLCGPATFVFEGDINLLPNGNAT